ITLTHREYIGAANVERTVGGNKFNIEPPRYQDFADLVHDGAVIIDPPRRVLHLPINAPAGLGRCVHAPQLPTSRSNPANSAATMSRARSISKTRGRTTP